MHCIGSIVKLVCATENCIQYSKNVLKVDSLTEYSFTVWTVHKKVTLWHLKK